LAQFNAGGHLEAAQPRHVFVEPNPVEFQVVGEDSIPLAWVLKDWLGNEIASGVTPFRSGTTLDIPNIDPGYYTLYYDRVTPMSKPGENSPSISFARLIDPKKRHASSNCPYALDTAQSWLAQPHFENNPFQPADAFVALSDLAQWAGVTQVRDRMSWVGANAGPGYFDWQQADLNADLLAQRGLQVLQVFHDAPGWTKAGTKAIPSDLLALYRFTRASAEHFKGRVTAWEFWNEPDGQFCPDPAWEFAAAQKAAFIGFTDGDPTAKVLIASNSSSPIAPFFDLVLRNGTNPYFDIFNFHFYRPLADFPGVIENKIQTLAQDKIIGKPMWMTEFSLADEGTGRGASMVPGSNLHEHDALQELQQADFLVKAFITAQSLGVERSFYYVLPPMNERQGEKVWGLLHWDWTVKPAYAALSNLTYQLGNMIYLGKLNAGNGVTAHLFETSDYSSQTVVAWAESERPVELSKQETKLSVTDLMGHSNTVTGSGVSASTTPIFITGLHGYRPDTPMQTRPRAGKLTVKLDLKTIFSIHFGPTMRVVKRTAIDLAAGQMASGTLWVYNLSNVPKTARLKVEADGVEIQGMPAQLTVAPYNSAQSSFTILKSATNTGGRRILITGTTEAGEITPVEVPIK